MSHQIDPVRDWTISSPYQSPGFDIQAENIKFSTNSEREEACDLFKELLDNIKGNLKRPIWCHLNINSQWHKFNDLKNLSNSKNYAIF